MKKKYLVLAFAAVFFLAPTIVAQCDCMRDLFPTKEEKDNRILYAFKEAQIVFYGQVIAVRKVDNIVDTSSDSNYEAEVFFFVEKAWKKDAPQILKLRQTVDGCIRSFNVGHRWLIYGFYDKEGYLRTGYCHPSKRADQKPELDLEEFRKNELREKKVKKMEQSVTITLN